MVIPSNRGLSPELKSCNLKQLDYFCRNCTKAEP
jgi:hypothetical protein